MKGIKGLGIALITPFKEDLSIDFSSLEKIIEYHISEGVEYLVILGTTAETAVLNNSEKKEIIDFVKKINNNRVPLVLGIGGNNTSYVVDEIRNVDFDGFTAILSVSPYYNKPTQEGIFRHYQEINKLSIPFIIYNVPGRTGANIESQTTLKMAENLEFVIAIKEAGDFLQALDILRDKPKNFELISGNDEMALPTVLAGGNGVISVLGNAFPKLFSEMIRLGLERKVDKAFEIHYQLLPLMKYIFKEGNPAGVKALMYIKNLCQPYTRLPLVPASKDLINKLKEELLKIE